MREELFEAAEQGDYERVSAIIFALPGTGFAPQRLSVLERTDAEGRTAADVAEAHGHHQIAELLRGEQQRMDFFE